MLYVDEEVGEVPLLGVAYGSGHLDEEQGAAFDNVSPPSTDAAPCQQYGADVPMTDATKSDGLAGGDDRLQGDWDAADALALAENDAALLPPDLRESVDAECDPKLVVRSLSLHESICT